MKNIKWKIVSQDKEKVSGFGRQRSPVFLDELSSVLHPTQKTLEACFRVDVITRLTFVISRCPSSDSVQSDTVNESECFVGIH